MRMIAKLPKNDLNDLFRSTAVRMGISDAIVEKDFWVCFTLDYLFNQAPWKNDLTFKGGTSLSKAFHVINRFSEDIDLVLAWNLVGYSEEEAWQDRSNTKQIAFNTECNQRVAEFLSKIFVPKLKMDLSKELGSEQNVYVDENDAQTIIFAYPNIFINPAIISAIRLELGVTGVSSPVNKVKIVPYAAEYYPSIFKQKSTDVTTIVPERTFWEKVTILHHEANRPEYSEMPKRYSRHYYDVYRMSATPIKDNALSNIELLKEVIRFKMKFYPRGWAKYQEALPATLKLVPPEYRLPSLKADYEISKSMLYGDIASFDKIIEALKDLETEINNL